MSEMSRLGTVGKRMGLCPHLGLLAEQLGTKLTPRGNVQVDARFATSVDGVFLAEDASRRASIIVWAFADGRETAKVVDTYLTREASALPTKDKDCALG